MNGSHERCCFLTDGCVLIGQEEHRLHARAALSVRPHGWFYPQVCGSLSRCGVTEGCLQDQRGPTGTNLCFILFLCVFLNGSRCVSLPLCFRMSVSSPTNFSTGWKMPFSLLPMEGRVRFHLRSSVFDTRQQHFLPYLQRCCRQTAESHGPAVLRNLCDREKN